MLPKIVEDVLTRTFERQHWHSRSVFWEQELRDELAKLFVQPNPSKEGDQWLMVVRDGGRGQPNPIIYDDEPGTADPVTEDD